MPRKCEVAGCEKPHRAKGYCAAHYENVRRYGDPESRDHYKIRQPGLALQWLLDHVDWPDREGCLPWPFNRNSAGYGRVRHNGREKLASRAMCIEVHGEPSDPSLEAAHSCGKGSSGCVNPNHLSWKTRKENEADKIEHGTRPCGEDATFSKLTSEEVAQIRQLLAEGNLLHREIGARFGVSRQTIDRIANGQAWKNEAHFTGAYAA